MVTVRGPALQFVRATVQKDQRAVPEQGMWPNPRKGRVGQHEECGHQELDHWARRVQMSLLQWRC